MSVVEIPTNKPGIVGIVDAADAAIVRAYKWIVHRSRRSRTLYLKTMVKRENVYLHRLLCDVWDSRRVDHRDGDGLNNRRVNLRVCSISLNNANSVRTPPASGFRGVYVKKRKWRALIGHESTQIGTFGCPVSAALAYDRAARARWGEFARFNFPRPGELPAFSDVGAA